MTVEVYKLITPDRGLMQFDQMVL